MAAAASVVVIIGRLSQLQKYAHLLSTCEFMETGGDKYEVCIWSILGESR
jgi:hypothetical protein